VSFFDSIPEPPPPEPVRERRQAWMRPEVVIPSVVPAQVVLIRTEQVAVAVGSVRAYPNGLEFTVHVRLRRDDEAVWYRHSDPFGRHRPRQGAEGSDDQLRLGILYADGRRAATTGDQYRPPDADDDDGRLVFQQNGGGGSPVSSEWDFWVHPLPPDGPVTLVASWLKYGVAESRAELDGTAIRAAGARAVTLWPEPESGPLSGFRSRRVSFTKPDDPEAADDPDAIAPGTGR
jgi:hypothetical protein